MQTMICVRTPASLKCRLRSMPMDDHRKGRAHADDDVRADAGLLEVPAALDADGTAADAGKQKPEAEVNRQLEIEIPQKHVSDGKCVGKMHVYFPFPGKQHSPAVSGGSVFGLFFYVVRGSAGQGLTVCGFPVRGLLKPGQSGPGGVYSKSSTRIIRTSVRRLRMAAEMGSISSFRDGSMPMCSGRYLQPQSL